jgi:hypothetical protein
VSETFTTPPANTPLLSAEELARQQPNLRLMKIIVTVLGVLILLAFIALIAGFVMRLNGRAPGSSNPVAAVYSLPAHSRVTSMQVAGGNRIVLTVTTRDGDEIDIFDTDTGRLVSKIAIPGSR